MGKGLEELLNAGKRTGVTVLRPKMWSETRFSPHAANVIRVFMHNMKTMVAVLNDRIEELNYRTGAAQQLEEHQRCLQGMFISHGLLIFTK